MNRLIQIVERAPHQIPGPIADTLGGGNRKATREARRSRRDGFGDSGQEPEQHFCEPGVKPQQVADRWRHGV